jgi:hypothetical protein
MATLESLRERRIEICRNYRDRNREKIRAYNKSRCRNQREHMSALTLAAIHRAPQKHRARSYVAWAISTGKLAKASTKQCVDCGEKAAHHDHYNGYAKKNYLVVEAVCTRCHAVRGSKRGEYDKLGR